MMSQSTAVRFTKNSFKFAATKRVGSPADGDLQTKTGCEIPALKGHGFSRADPRKIGMGGYGL